MDWIVVMSIATGRGENEAADASPVGKEELIVCSAICSEQCTDVRYMRAGPILQAGEGACDAHKNEHASLLTAQQQLGGEQSEIWQDAQTALEEMRCDDVLASSGGRAAQQ